MTIDWLMRPTTSVVDLSPGSVDLRGYRGDTFATRFTFRYADGTPVLLGGTWAAQLRSSPSSSEVLDSFYVDTAGQAGGVVLISLTAAQTTALAQRTVWDLQNVDGSTVRTWLNGSLHIAGDVTRTSGGGGGGTTSNPYGQAPYGTGPYGGTS